MATIKRASLLHPWPLAVAVLGVLVTLVAGFAASRWMDEHVGDEFSYDAERTAATIQQRFDTYQEVLRGLQGLFVSTQEVSRAEFRAYVELLRMSERYHGVEEYWFARHVSATERPGYEARVRRELGRTREEVVGKMRFTDLLTPASGKTFLESYSRFKECGWLRDLQLEIAREDGTSLSVLLNATAVKDAASRFVMSRSMMIDITGTNLPLTNAS